MSIEGVDGSGKTSVIKEIKKYFYNNKNIVYTREPGGTDNEISEKIRRLVLENDMDINTEALLFAASRSENVAKFIIPNLEKNKIVISDRYLDSSLVYQGIGRNIGIENIYNMNMIATNNLLPNRTYILVISPKISNTRILSNRNSSETNRFDVEQDELQKKVYDGYLLLANKYPERIVLIDASKDLETVSSNIIKNIEVLIKEHELQ